MGIQKGSGETYDIDRHEVIKHYSVNEVVTLCGVTRKQLLYYEERNLIRQVVRHPENNYRFYTETHLKQILLIKELKLLGFSLDEISGLMQNNDMAAIKRATRRRMENAKTELNKALAQYEQSSEKLMQVMEAVSVWEANLGPKPMPLQKSVRAGSGAVKYELVDFPPQQVVSLCYEGSFSDQEKVYYEQLSRLHTIVEAYDLTILGSVINIYYQHFCPQSGVFDDALKKIEICLAVADKQENCPHCRQLKGFRGVAVTHLGKHEPDLRMTYKALLNWAGQQGLEVSANSVEEWLISPVLTSNDEFWVTKIIIPLVGESF